MKLLNGDRAIIDERKLVDYCLNVSHLRGRHKARVFEAALGITSLNYWILRDGLRSAAASGNAVSGEADQFGERFIIDFELQGPAGVGTVRSAWIVLNGEDIPRLVSCYVV